VAISLTHTTVAAGTDAGNGEIRKVQWNEEHTITMATARLLGRTTAGAGAVEELSVSANLTLSGGTLDTSANPQFTSIELGNASDTTITRNDAGVLAVEGGVIPKENRANVFTQTQSISRTTADAEISMWSNAGYGSVLSLNVEDGGGNRWKISRTNGAESGSNAGSEFGIFRYADNGSFLGTALSITRANGDVYCQGIYDKTGTGTAVQVDSGGAVFRSSSSIKYKKDVEDLDAALVDTAIASLRPVWYRTKEATGDDKPSWSHIGLIAEEVALVEPRLVRYRTQTVEEKAPGERIVTELATPEPEDVDYARLSVLLLDKVQRLEERLAVLEAAQ
jgi:hypothetical protein